MALNEARTIETQHRYAVIGDFSRTIYSRHPTHTAAERACRSLARKWGWSHPGSEPAVIKL